MMPFLVSHTRGPYSRIHPSVHAHESVMTLEERLRSKMKYCISVPVCGMILNPHHQQCLYIYTHKHIYKYTHMFNCTCIFFSCTVLPQLEKQMSN